jgi:Rps23 Pro-64 3,4-dihydroxylase Tpa1-like proline 4-hydroxylase
MDQRRHGQRPHDRYYLAYEDTHYKRGEELDKEVTREELPSIWVAFLEEIKNNAIYRKLIENVLGTDDWQVRFAWHMGQKGNEVSPHLDHIDKLGTHIFYFNTDEDWKSEWGGQLVVLGEKMIPTGNPEYEDFASAVEISNLNNRSFLFKNTLDAWHGVRPLRSPEGQFRRVFNVIFEPT